MNKAELKQKLDDLYVELNTARIRAELTEVRLRIMLEYKEVLLKRLYDADNQIEKIRSEYYVDMRQPLIAGDRFCDFMDDYIQTLQP